jgi:hypothetical protein
MDRPNSTPFFERTQAVAPTTIELPIEEAAIVSEREYGILTEVPEEGLRLQETAEYLRIDASRLKAALRARKIPGITATTDFETARFSRGDIDRIADFYDGELSAELAPWAQLVKTDEDRDQLMDTALNSREP